MLSPVFWLSLMAVFLGTKWAAEGLMSLVRVEIRAVATGPPAREATLSSDAASGRGVSAVGVLDQAA